MALTDRDIQLFARDAVFDGCESEITKQARARYALSYISTAEKSVRDSGYRVTRRVHDLLWEELCRLERDATIARHTTADAPSFRSAVAIAA